MVDGAGGPNAGGAARASLRLADGLEVVQVAGGVVLANAMSVLRLEGGVASAVADVIVPRLDPTRDRHDLLSSFPDAVQAEVGHLLDRLVDAGLLVEVPAAGEAEPAAWTSCLSGRLSERQALARRLASARVTVIGQGAGVEETLRGLLDVGVGRVRCAVPAGAGPFLGTTAREPTPVEWSTTDIDQAATANLVAGQDLVVTLLPPALSAVRVWVNTAGLRHDVPTLNVAVDGPLAHVGPLVLPGEGPCYLCWRMRALACEDDFETAMAREEAFDAARGTGAVVRPVLPSVPPAVAAAVVHDVLALLVALSQPRLTGHVLRLHALEGDGLHPVLPRPDCPACSKKDRPRRAAPSLDQLVALPERDTDFEHIARSAVSPVCGLVRALDRIPKDVLEPELPVVVRTELANARFAAGDAGFVGCSGKGDDVVTARDLALAEAVERHCALTWQPATTVRARRADLRGESLDPRELVLFAPEQYAGLPYAPYHDDLELDWVPSRSLRSGADVWVPVAGVHLGNPESASPAALFPATSNGFAAGPTLADAVLAAALEVVERDAFLVAWAHRLVTTPYDARTVPDRRVQAVAHAYARRGVRIAVHLLPTDSAACAALAVGWSDEAPAAVVGLGAGLDPVSAARRAVLEVGQVRPALRARLRRPEVAERLAELVADPDRVETLEDHDLLYADAGFAMSAMAHLRHAPVSDWTAPAGAPTTPREELRTLVTSLVGVAGDVLYLDVATTEADQLGISVAKVVVPGFQPIHFGARENRLGHERLRRVPHDLGLTAAQATLDELNRTPHPLA